MSEPILKVKGLKVHFPVSGGFLAKKQVVKAVDGGILRLLLVKLLA